MPKASLKNVPLLEALSAQARTQLLRQSIVHAVPPGTIVFRQGDTPTFQHLILEGSFHLLGRSGANKEVLIEAVGPPDLLLPAAIVTGSPYLLTARAHAAAQLLLIQADAFRNAVLDNPLVAQQIIGSLAGQFRRMLRQIKNLKLRGGLERVGCYLIALAIRQQNARDIRLPYEKNLIASELGMTPESLSRALLALQRSGIEVHGDRILIDDILHLANVVGVDPLIDGQDILTSLSKLAGRKGPMRRTTAARKARVTAK